MNTTDKKRLDVEEALKDFGAEYRRSYQNSAMSHSDTLRTEKTKAIREALRRLDSAAEGGGVFGQDFFRNWVLNPQFACAFVLVLSMAVVMKNYDRIEGRELVHLETAAVQGTDPASVSDSLDDENDAAFVDSNETNETVDDNVFAPEGDLFEDQEGDTI